MHPAAELLKAAIEHHQGGRLNQAEQIYRHVLDSRSRKSPGIERWQVDAWHGLGLIHHAQGHDDQAIDRFQKAVELRPDFAAAHHNLGIVLFQPSRLPEAIACYRKAIEDQPGPAEAHWNLSQLLLLTADFERGWPEYEWRWKTGQGTLRELGRPRWTGQQLHGQSHVIHAEPGLGDTFQFIRYAALVKNLGATVLFLCTPALRPLLTRCPGIDQLRSRLPSFPAGAGCSIALTVLGIRRCGFSARHGPAIGQASLIAWLWKCLVLPLP